MTSQRCFRVTCRHCEARVVTTPLIGDAELTTLLAHVRGCSPETVPSEPRGIEALLRHFDVRPEGAG